MTSTVSEKIIVREAKREDMLQICQLIKDLARYEDMEDQVKINPETLIKDGFETIPPCFGCFVAALENNLIIGYALYFNCYSTWVGKSIFLEDLYVEEKYRQCGVGKKLLLATAQVAYDTGKRLDFHVLTTNPAVKFYNKLGAMNASEIEKWQLFRFEETELKSLLNNEL